MTQQEKARELISKFENNTALNLVADLSTTESEIKSHNKKCALLAVNEIINSWKEDGHHDLDKNIIWWWECVKDEIEKL